MKNAVILHGTDGNSKDNWIPWLKTQLEMHEYKVWTPDLPGADMPNAKKYNDYLIKQKWDFNEETVIIGHSSGAIAALQLLQSLPKETKVKSVYCVGAFKDNLHWRTDDKKLKLEGLFEKELDFPMLRTKAGEFIFIHSVDDPFCPPEHASYLAVKLQGKLTMMHGQKHFSTSTMGDQYKEFPMLLEMILAEPQPLHLQ